MDRALGREASRVAYASVKFSVGSQLGGTRGRRVEGCKEGAKVH